jgi:hypothetical protein
MKLNAHTAQKPRERRQPAIKFSLLPPTESSPILNEFPNRVKAFMPRLVNHQLARMLSLQRQAIAVRSKDRPMWSVMVIFSRR